MSLLDRLVEAVEGDVRGIHEAVPHRMVHAPVAALASDENVSRIDADVLALAADGRQAVLRGFDLAASAEELASVSGVTRAMEDADRKVRDALAGVRGASGMILDLTKAVEEMACVVDAVASLARQANLLALHATIEAARAGEAGRGLTSVAGDVKSLSEETSHTARDIRARIARLRDTAGSSTRAVERIAAVIQETQPALAAIAAAVEDRNASLRQVAQQATDLSIAVGGLSTRAEQVAGAAPRGRFDATYRY